MKRCQWTLVADWEDEVPEPCEEEATHTTCLVRGAVVCGKHKCRCSQLILQLDLPWGDHHVRP
jgi:hypothetical protein